MKKYLVNEFKDGEEVYHLTNPRLKMLVIGREESKNEVICRWVDQSNKSNKEVYLAVELAKFSDKPSNTIILGSPRRNNSY